MTAPAPFSRQGIQQTHNLGLDTFAFDIAKRLSVCLSDQLVFTIGGPVCRVGVYPGGEIVPMDICCEGQNCLGMAATRVYRIFPVTGRFPQQDFSPRLTNCDSMLYGITIEMTVYRCAAVLTETGQPPSMAEIERDAKISLDDAAAMRRAVRCCYSKMANREVDGVRLPYTVSGDWVEDDWNPMGPLGDCHGGRQRIMLPVTIENCDYEPNPIVRPA